MNSNGKCDKIQTNRKRLQCPSCGKFTVLFYLPDTQVKNLPVKCKLCGKESIVNISPESQRQ